LTLLSAIIVLTLCSNAYSFLFLQVTVTLATETKRS